MKWGVRRYQNKDGSLTKAGEKKAKRTEKKEKKKEFRKDVKDYKKGNMSADVSFSPEIGGLTIDQAYNSNGQKIGKEYFEKVQKRATEETVFAKAATYAAVGSLLNIGAIWLDDRNNRR